MRLARLFLTGYLLGVCCVTAAAGSPPAAAVASTHPLATAAGEQVLRAGGNAFDAAVAVTAALAVVEPYGTGLGGSGIWLLHIAEEHRQIMVDGRARAPSLAHWRMFGELEEPEPGASGPINAAIPGIPAGIVYLAETFGRLPLRQSLAPAVRYAREGFRVGEHYRGETLSSQALLQAYPRTAAIFLSENASPVSGATLIQTDLAGTLELIAQSGRDAIYTGRIAEQMVLAVRANGGLWSLEDLADYRLILREPIRSDYQGVRITAAAPPSAGGVALNQILKMLGHFELQQMDPVLRAHYIIEAMRRSYRDLAVYLGDPDFVSVPQERLLDDDYIAGLSLTFDAGRATASTEIGDTPGPFQDNSRTGHFSVIDTEGNRVGGTLTLSGRFGCGFVVEGTGILLNDAMRDFSQGDPAAGQANAVQPGKRPMTSMTPVFLEAENRLGILGAAGGNRVISMLALAVLDFSAARPPVSWVSLPRYHHQYLPDVVSYETSAFSQAELNRLRRMGHRFAGTSRGFGDMQAVMWDKQTGRVLAASDPRGNGTAVIIRD